jgi:thiosulfate dehydrogenase
VRCATRGRLTRIRTSSRKFSEQLGKFATLRDMINWCIEKPNQGVMVESDSDAMKALEAYHYWSTRGSKTDPGRH